MKSWVVCLNFSNSFQNSLKYLSGVEKILYMPTIKIGHSISLKCSLFPASTLHFTYEPEDLLVKDGMPATLDCQAKLGLTQNGGLIRETPVISWRTDDGQLITFIGDKYRSVPFFNRFRICQKFLESFFYDGMFFDKLLTFYMENWRSWLYGFSNRRFCNKKK